VIEDMNARHLQPDALPDGLRTFDLITIDVSFISLAHIWPVLPALLAADGRVVALVKPQFEAGRTEVGAGGIVRDPAIHARVIEEVSAIGRSGRIESTANGALAGHGRGGQPGIPHAAGAITMTSLLRRSSGAPA
jgi:23S rRNA (cytidine1920-2'-O)/16S rRNA (cytidine1409-2'-O)-methyltransferase